MVSNFQLFLMVLGGVSGAVWLADVVLRRMAVGGAAVVDASVDNGARAQIAQYAGFFFFVSVVILLIMWWGLELFLVLSTLFSGVVWLVDKLWLRQRRAQKDGAKAEPVVVEYSRSFFPVLLAVLLLRSFVVEPFRIPSGSMMPTLLVGDFILVNKYHYGLRLPVSGTQVTEGEAPQRGDVVVFKYPLDPQVNFIKRIVGVPGDHIVYLNKVLYINGVEQAQADVGLYDLRGSNPVYVKREMLDGVEHQILIEQGKFTGDGETVVPPGQYFVMGDNRDGSNDSRRWGMVPEENLVGKAFFIWLNWDFPNGQHDFSRIGNGIQ